MGTRSSSRIRAGGRDSSCTCCESGVAMRPEAAPLVRAKLAGHTLRDDFPSVFVQSASLRHCLDSSLHLRVVLQLDLVAFDQAKDRSEDLALDLALDPGEILSDVGFRIADVVLVKVAAKLSQHLVVGREVLADLRFQELRSEEHTSELQSR